MILTLDELDKATNNFDKVRELGSGGHGTVYKGILSSLHVVAIKKSKIMIQTEIDDFINEVVILSQINHRNIVKLHGCCLEVEVPLLVYEFIPNCTLYNHLHINASISLPWKDRVRIAVETARALAYLHSLVSMPIIHRDVKSPNILLDDNLTVKLSDFGASRYIPIDKTGLDTTVQGTFGYLDPTYHSTGHLTEKSDVYSFGVILIELLTRKKPVSYRSPDGNGLVNYFTSLLSKGNVSHILDPQVIREGGGEVVDIALLAAICVKLVSNDRPTMRQVEMTLEGIHAAKEYYVSSDLTDDESEESYIQANGLPVIETCLQSWPPRPLLLLGCSSRGRHSRWPPGPTMLSPPVGPVIARAEPCSRRRPAHGDRRERERCERMNERDSVLTSCHSSYGTCHATTRPHANHSYVCRCNDGYQGNPYLRDGCQDIDECMLPDTPCFGNCTNVPGTYLCQCPEGTTGNPHARNGCVQQHHLDTHQKGLIVGLGVGSGAMLVFLVLGTTFIIRTIKIRRKQKMRQRFFKQNRGQLLQQLVCQRSDIGERMIVTLEELEKATNNFDRTREIGGGGHGTIYKGILSSLHVVAIKKSKIVIQREIDEFINEVAILSQINHKNIVKLLGCCLETEVPLLVYEFISNGTLHNHLHVEASVSLSWKDRLRIAVEIAKALAYLHSLISMPIIHRDVKSPNILLDDNLTVKLSDFGASRYVPVDQSGLDTTVQGTFGYLDPMYHSTGHLTEKSDVYSFGVILIELLTRKKHVSYRSPYGHGLVYHFVTLLSEGNLDQIVDTQVSREGGGEVVDIALLAAICVKFTSKDRPTMRQVEMTLESIHAAKEFASSDNLTDESGENDIRANDLPIGGRSVDPATCQD
ncbi:unnamed protein product [Urochloa decumbens]|uniref:Uncharacterized protein n=1 Tax=Urochloa decumbens TaxID=240449 RepID=A0ABC8VUR5_9POAL